MSLVDDLTDRIIVLERANAELAGQVQAANANLAQARIAAEDAEKRLQVTEARLRLAGKLIDIKNATIEGLEYRIAGYIEGRTEPTY